MNNISYCSNDYFCKWPIGKDQILNCSCFADYLNIGNSCCLNMWWFIGLALAAGVIVILIAIAGCVLWRMAVNKAKKLEKETKAVKHDLWAQSASQVSLQLPANASSRPNNFVLENQQPDYEEDDINLNGHLVMQSNGVVKKPSQRYSDNLVGFQPMALVSAEAMTAVERKPSQNKQKNEQQTNNNNNSYQNNAFDYNKFSPQLDKIDTAESYTIKRPTVDLDFAFY